MVQGVCGMLEMPSSSPLTTLATKKRKRRKRRAFDNVEMNVQNWKCSFVKHIWLG